MRVMTFEGDAMRPAFMSSGGITKFFKANPRQSFRLMVKRSFDADLIPTAVQRAQEMISAPFSHSRGEGLQLKVAP